LATSNRRKEGVPELVLRSMVSPLPMIVRLSAFLPPITGSPLAPLEVLFTAVMSKVVLATRVMVFAPPALFAALMSAIRSAVVAAVKLDGSERSSSASSRGRNAADLRADPRQRRSCVEVDFQLRSQDRNDMMLLLSGTSQSSRFGGHELIES